MKKRGKSVSRHGSYQVFTMVEVALSGKEEIIGYVVVGPGSDSTWIIGGIDEAIGQAKSLSEKYDSSFEPK